MANGTIAASQIEMLSLSGTGIITITPPATNTNRAITLPDAAGAIVVSGTTPSLNGITFPATQVSSADANTLDDYEEGTWTPTVTSALGTLTTASGTGQYQKVGNSVEFKATLTITTNGTGAGSIIFTLPFTGTSSNTGGLLGRESGATGNLVFGFMTTTTGVVYKYDGSYPAGSGYILNMSGWYFV